MNVGKKFISQKNFYLTVQSPRKIWFFVRIFIFSSLSFNVFLQPSRDDPDCSPSCLVEACLKGDEVDR